MKLLCKSAIISPNLVTLLERERKRHPEEGLNHITCKNEMVSAAAAAEENVHKQCDQKKIAKCLLKLPKNDLTRKMKDFDTFTKIA